ncbi:MAG TPA: hypothetical protein VM529_05660 [Gemmata sp.]|nr:hypothetical protein [Gemmata sp.]
MTTLRRFAVLQLLLAWQGGFLFYTAVVVPAGTQVLGSAAAQGAITARVTDWLNVLGVAGLLAMAWDMNYAADRSARRVAARWWAWGAAVAGQLVLLYVHLLMDALMDPGRTRVVIRPPFYPLHRVYLWASTVQWAACLVWLWLTLRAWRGERESYQAGLIRN